MDFKISGVIQSDNLCLCLLINRESPWIIYLDAGIIYREIRWILKFRM